MKHLSKGYVIITYIIYDLKITKIANIFLNKKKYGILHDL